MPHYHVDGNDLDMVIAEFGKAAEPRRRGEGPSYIVANTYRFRGHSMSDADEVSHQGRSSKKPGSAIPITLYRDPSAGEQA